MAPMSSTTATGAAVGAIMAYLTLFELVVTAFVLAALWRVFTKAGRPGWAAIVPVYNAYTLLKTVGRPGWWVVLLVIPFVNLVVLAIVQSDLAQSFAKGGGFAIGLFFLPFIFMPILAFSDARYVGPPRLRGAWAL